jgi:hypothetical protein
LFIALVGYEFGLAFLTAEKEGHEEHEEHEGHEELQLQLIE